MLSEEFLLNLIKIVMKEALFALLRVCNGLDKTAPFPEGQRQPMRSSQVQPPEASVGPRGGERPRRVGGGAWRDGSEVLNMYCVLLFQGQSLVPSIHVVAPACMWLKNCLD